MECISEDLYNVLFVAYFMLEVLCYWLLLIYNMVLWCVIGMVCIIIVQRCAIDDGLYHHGTVVWF